MRQLKLSSSPHARHLLPPSLIVFVIIMLSINNTTAAATPPPTTTSLDANSQHQGNEALQTEIDNPAKVGHSGDVHFDHLMGLEQSCEDGDDECLKRRLMSAANLDYIYTQHHNP